MLCEMCEGRFDELKLKEYRFWTVYLHKNQFYLGRAIIKLNRHIEDVADILEPESKELFSVIREYQDVLRRSFSPDLFNYAFLGNRDRHVHLHIIPRYASERVFGDIKFNDLDWGNPFDMHKRLELNSKETMWIANAIKERLLESESR